MFAVGSRSFALSAPCALYIVLGFVCILNLWNERRSIADAVPFGSLLFVCGTQFFRPTLLGWRVLVASSSLLTVGVARSMFMDGNFSFRSLLQLLVVAFLTTGLFLHRPATSVLDRRQSIATDYPGSLPRWQIGTILVIFLGLTFFAYKFPVQRTTIKRTEEEWPRVSAILERKGNISEVIDIMGNPDAVQQHVSYDLRGNSGTGSCYWWGEHAVLVSTYDEAIGTCYWARKP